MLKTYVPPWLRESSMWWSYPDTSEVCVTSRAIHGDHYLPSGYSFAFVPRNAKVESLTSSSELVLCSLYNFPKLIVALFQTIYASFTLFQSRGDQITRYGYAAFGLTVLPYAVMSSINLIGNMITPDYPVLYVVQSEVMLEAEKCGARFQGVVGKLVCSPEAVTEQQHGVFSVAADLDKRERETTLCVTEEDANNGPASSTNSHGGEDELVKSITNTLEVQLSSNKTAEDPAVEPFPILWIPACPPFERSDASAIHAGHTSFMEQLDMPLFTVFIVVVLINGIILGILGKLTDGFNAGGSTLAQRVWTMMWLVFGFVIGLGVAMVPVTAAASDISTLPLHTTTNSKDFFPYEKKLVSLSFAMVYCAPAVGGLVVVGQMLRDYGSCEYFG